MNVVADTIRNGVDTEKLFATLDLIKAQPELAKFQFRVRNRWIDGSHNRSRIKDFYAAGGEDKTRSEEFLIDAGEPAILLGTDTTATGPIPSRRSTRSRPPATSPRPSPSTSVGSACPPPTIWSWRQAAWRAATPT